MSNEIDALIKAASGTINKEKKDHLPHGMREIINFVAEFNITEGSMPIHKALIYDYYVRWSKNPIGKIGFFRHFKPRFPTKWYNGVEAYYLDPTCFDLPPFYTMATDTRFIANKRAQARFYGVYETFGYYVARLQTEENLHYLGRFKTAREAAIEYDKQAIKHFGHNAKLNFPKDGKANETQEEK